MIMLDFLLDYYPPRCILSVLLVFSLNRPDCQGGLDRAGRRCNAPDREPYCLGSMIMSTVTQNTSEVNAEALHRAVTSQSLTNYPTIFQGFIARGIPEDEIMPRENIFTYAAWKALGRQVKKGEHGVKICTFIPMESKEKDPETDEIKVKTSSRPRMTTVFHISQTKGVA